MSFDVISGTLSAAVASGGTFSVAYPTGRSKGNYLHGAGHVLIVNGNEYALGSKFTISLGTNSAGVTVTNAGSTSWPNGGTFRLQLEHVGQNDGRPMDGTAPVSTGRMVQATDWFVDLGSPNTSAASAMCTSQAVATSGSFSLNGSIVSNGVAVLDVPRNVVAAWSSSAQLTITGTDEFGATMVEKSASGTSHTGIKAFKTVTSITTDNGISAATVGFGNVLGLPVYVGDAAYIKEEWEDGVLVGRAAEDRVYVSYELDGVACSSGLVESVVIPITGKIVKHWAVTNLAASSAGTLTLSSAGTTVTNGTVTIASSGTTAAAGTMFSSATPTAAHNVTAGDVIKITPAAFTAGEVSGVIEIQPTAAGRIRGTFVAGSQSAPGITSGDVRGTYTPFTTPDGTTGYRLAVRVPDPAYKGLPQYAG